MLYTIFYGRLRRRHFIKLGVALFAVVFATFFLTYGLLRFCLFANVFSLVAEAQVLLQMAGVSAAVAGGILLLLYAAELADAFRRRLRRWRRAGAAAVVTVALAGCLQAQSVGTFYDAATGMHTGYHNLVPTATKLVMNGDVLGHAQIPLGEKFTILNESVEGFVQKENKVAVGCSLTVTDEAGKVLLQMADLFAAKEIFTVTESRSLKCIVSTGKPMAYDKSYTVTAVFWDKWGKGRITNRVTIETIDLP